MRSLVAASLVATVSFAQPAKPLPTPGEPPNACDLLSRLDVKEATGIPVGEGMTRTRTATLTSCWFAGEGGGKAAILVRRVPSGDWVCEQVARMNRGVQWGTYREVSGIGERSFLYVRQKGGAVLCVFGAGYYLQVWLDRMGEDCRKQAVLERLATTALMRLRLTGRRPE